MNLYLIYITIEISSFLFNKINITLMLISIEIMLLTIMILILVSSLGSDHTSVAFYRLRGSIAIEYK